MAAILGYLGAVQHALRQGGDLAHDPIGGGGHKGRDGVADYLTLPHLQRLFLVGLSASGQNAVAQIQDDVGILRPRPAPQVHEELMGLKPSR